MLDRDSADPLHQQLSELLARRIASGQYQPGEMIPPERELCEQYGVSITTVRKAVLDLAALGLVERAVGRGTYVRKPAQRQVRIGLVTTYDLALSEAAIMPVVTAIQESAGQRNASLRHFHQAEPGPLAEHLQQIIGRDDVQGIVLFTHQRLHYADLAALIASGFPYIVFNRYLDDQAINCIVMNDAEAAAQAVAHLYDLGHRQIAHLPGLLHTTVGRDRTDAYCDAMLARGLTPWVWDAGWSIEEGIAVTTAMLSARRHPTALLASSDHTAIGALHALRRAGLRVPEDVSVIGFANLPGADLVDPPLTTMGYDRELMGQRTITALLALVEGGPTPGKIVVPAQFVVRQSCAPPGAAAPRARSATAPLSGSR